MLLLLLKQQATFLALFISGEDLGTERERETDGERVRDREINQTSRRRHNSTLTRFASAPTLHHSLSAYPLTHQCQWDLYTLPFLCTDPPHPAVTQSPASGKLSRTCARPYPSSVCPDPPHPVTQSPSGRVGPVPDSYTWTSPE